MKVTENEIVRFDKQIGLQHVGIEGIEKIKDTTVFIAGLGGGGCSALLQIALSNIGRVVLCDHDEVDYSNLGRQFLHSEDRVGMSKVESAKIAIKMINPYIEVITYHEPISTKLLEKVKDLYSNLFIFVAVDKFYAHYEINEFCIKNHIPAVHIAQFGYKGFLYTYNPDRSSTCFRCTLEQCYDKKSVTERFDKNGPELPYLAPAISIVCGLAIVEILKLRLGLTNKSMHNKFLIYRGVDHTDLFEDRKEDKDIFEIIETKPGDGCAQCSKIKSNEFYEYNSNGLIDRYEGHLTSFRNLSYEILNTNNKFKYKYVTIWMSRECNSRCKHCYQGGNPDGSGWDYNKADKITDLFLNEGYIVFPIVNEWLPKYWDMLKILKKCNASEITTNGLILLTKHKDFFQKLLENNITKIKFTLFPESYMEYYTGRKYKDIQKCIKLAVADNFSVTLNFVAMKDTIESIPNYCREAVSLGVNEVQFMNYFCTDKGSNMYSQVLTKADINRFWELYNVVKNDEICNCLKLDQQASFGPNPYCQTDISGMHKKKMLCLAGEGENGFFLYVDPECKIYPCPMLSDSAFEIGEIIETDYGYYSFHLKPNEIKHNIKGFDRSICSGQLYSDNLRTDQLRSAELVK